MNSYSEDFTYEGFADAPESTETGANAGTEANLLTKNVTKPQFTKIVGLVITLLVAHALRLQLTTGFSLDGYNKYFFYSVGGLVIGQVINTLLVSKLFEDPDGDLPAEEAPINNHYDKGLNTELIQDMVELLVMLASQQLFMNSMLNRPLRLSEVAMRNMFLAVCGILLYRILVHPILSKQTLIAEGSVVSNQTLVTGIGEVVKKVMSLATADYMADLDFDNFQTEAGINAAGVLVGELSSTPLVEKSGLSWPSN